MKGMISRREFLKLTAAGAVGLGASPFIAACVPAATPAPSKPIKVGLLITFTGPAGLFGPPTKNCADLAIKEINDKGGVLGRSLELVVGDDATDPQKANEEMNRLVYQETVDFVIGMHSSASREAAKPIAGKEKKLYMYTPVYEGGECDQYIYVLGEVPNQQLGPVIPFIMQEYGGKSWYLLGNDYNWPRNSNAAAKAFIEQAGGSIAGEEYVPLGTTEYSAIISRIDSSKAEHLFQTLVGADGITFQKQFFDFGLRSKVQTLTTLFEENSVYALGAEAARGIRSSFAYFKNLDIPKNQEFLGNYTATFGKDAPPVTSLSESVYEALHIFALGAAKAGSLDVDALLKGLGGVEFDGPRGKVQLNSTDRHLAQHIYLGEVDDATEYRIVKDFGLVEPNEACRVA
ncbi:MAG: ABC transporter substrate-binding protein [Anaerolineae bacterium]